MNGNIPEDDWLGRVEGLSDDNTEAPDTGKHRIHLPKIPKPVDKPKPVPDEPEESGQPEKPDGIPAVSPESIPEEKPVIHRPARKMTFLRENGVRSDMTDMIIALLPLAAWGVYLYGARVMTLVLISVIFSVLFDYLTPVVLKKPDTVSDLSGAVIGLMTALLMPASAPLWLPVFGAFVSVVLVKHIAGSLTRIRLHPSAAAAAVMYIAFPGIMCAVPEIKTKFAAFSVNACAYKTAVLPLEKLMSGSFPAQSDWDLFFGMRPGAVGEISAFLIIAGAVWLMARRVTDLRQPLAFVLTLGILSYAFPRLAIASDLLSIRYAVDCVFVGNAVFCAFLMTSYPGPAPVSRRARLASGIIGGALLFGLRSLTAPCADAVPVILAMNLVARPLDLILKPSVLGGTKKKKTDSKTT